VITRCDHVEGNFPRLQVNLCSLELATLNKLDSHACHFRHKGLNEAAPFGASLSVLQQKNACPLALRACCDRNGSSFASYVIKGKVSKRRFTGAGTLNMERFAGLDEFDVDFAWPLAGADEDIVMPS
jgi:hypothetical protein